MIVFDNIHYEFVSVLMRFNLRQFNVTNFIKQTMAIKFSPAVLSSDKTLNDYLYAKSTIEAIKAEAKQPYVVQGYGRLGILDAVWLTATLPVNLLSSLFLKVTGNLLNTLQAKTTAQKLLVLANYIEHSPNRLIAAIYYGNNLLVSTLNVLSPDKAEEIYTHPPIPIDKVHPNIIFRSNNSTGAFADSPIYFDKIDGQCSGMSDWAAHLYFRTKHAFRNQEHHLVAIASHLAKGAGKEAALWQRMQHTGPSAYAHQKKILGIFLKCSKARLAQANGPTPKHLEKWLKAKIQFMERMIRKSDNKLPPLLGIKRIPAGSLIKPNLNELVKLFKLLPPGFYAVGSPRHRFNFIKGKTIDYVMEPNKGLIAIRSTKELQDYMKFIVEEGGVELFQLKKP